MNFSTIIKAKKGGGKPIGTISTYRDGSKHQKMRDGKWKMISEPKKAKKEKEGGFFARLFKKIQKAANVVFTKEETSFVNKMTDVDQLNQLKDELEKQIGPIKEKEPKAAKEAEEPKEPKEAKEEKEEKEEKEKPEPKKKEGISKRALLALINARLLKLEGKKDAPKELSRKEQNEARRKQEREQEAKRAKEFSEEVKDMSLKELKIKRDGNNPTLGKIAHEEIKRREAKKKDAPKADKKLPKGFARVEYKDLHPDIVHPKDVDKNKKYEVWARTQAGDKIVSVSPDPDDKPETKRVEQKWVKQENWLQETGFERFNAKNTVEYIMGRQAYNTNPNSAIRPLGIFEEGVDPNKDVKLPKPDDFPLNQKAWDLLVAIKNAGADSKKVDALVRENKETANVLKMNTMLSLFANLIPDEIDSKYLSKIKEQKNEAREIRQRLQKIVDEGVDTVARTQTYSNFKKYYEMFTLEAFQYKPGSPEYKMYTQAQDDLIRISPKLHQQYEDTYNKKMGGAEEVKQKEKPKFKLSESAKKDLKVFKDIVGRGEPIVALRQHFDLLDEKGRVSAEQHRATFDFVVENELKVKEGLRKLSVKELKQLVSPFSIYSGIKKDQLVDAVYDQTTTNFLVGVGGISYSGGEGARTEAIKDKLKDLTDNKLEEARLARIQRRQERQKEIAEYQDQMAEERAKKEEQAVKEAKIEEAAKDNPKLQAIDREIAQLEARRKTNNAVNKIVRNKKLSREEKIKKIQAEGFTERSAESFLKPAGYGTDRPVGVPSYVNQNLGAKIRARKDKRKDIARNAVSVTGPVKFNKFGGGSVIDNQKDDRIQIAFNEKPSADVRYELKRRGFRWSPSREVWQAYRTERSRDGARSILGFDPFEVTVKSQQMTFSDFLGGKKIKKSQPWNFSDLVASK